MKWNPRYVCYAAAHGRTPKRQRKADRSGVFAASPGTGFILWMSARWQEWHAARGLKRFDCVLSDADHADFDAWLPKRATELFKAAA